MASQRALARQHGLANSTLRHRLQVQLLPLSEALARPVLATRDTALRASEGRLPVYSWERVKRACRRAERAVCPQGG